MLRLGLPVAAAVIAADQASKWAVRDALWDPQRRIEVTSFFNLVPVQNKGISFGLFQSEGAGVWLIVGLALAVSAGLVVWLYRTRLRWPAWALGLVIGGAIGNVIDRLRLGWVIDFLDFHGGGYHWPAFNLADSAISVGVVMLVVQSFLMKPPKEPRKDS
ncbi:MAG: signal peptidase II [Rhodospirillales bacterium]|nr:signal peptidase II [Rhodospirillales bacterium]